MIRLDMVNTHTRNTRNTRATSNTESHRHWHQRTCRNGPDRCVSHSCGAMYICPGSGGRAPRSGTAASPKHVQASPSFVPSMPSPARLDALSSAVRSMSPSSLLDALIISPSPSPMRGAIVIQACTMDENGGFCIPVELTLPERQRPTPLALPGNDSRVSNSASPYDNLLSPVPHHVSTPSPVTHMSYARPTTQMKGELVNQLLVKLIKAVSHNTTHTHATHATRGQHQTQSHIDTGINARAGMGRTDVFRTHVVPCTYAQAQVVVPPAPVLPPLPSTCKPPLPSSPACLPLHVWTPCRLLCGACPRLHCSMRSLSLPLHPPCVVPLSFKRAPWMRTADSASLWSSHCPSDNDPHHWHCLATTVASATAPLRMITSSPLCHTMSAHRLLSHTCRMRDPPHR